MSPAPSNGSGRAVAITGLGAVSAWGWSTAELWRGLASGRTAVGPFTTFDHSGHRTHLAAAAPPPPAALAAAVPGWRRLAAAERFAVAAAREAVAGAGEMPPPAATGIYFGGSTAGMIESEETFAARLVAGPGADSGDPARRGLRPGELRRLAAQPINNPADAVARHLGTTGPVVTISSACASGTQALGLALDALRDGEVEVALAGGADALCRLTYAGFNSLRLVDETACRPLRAGRAGMSLGEGAGVLVLEPLERALARGARPLALVAGSGDSCDAHHMTAPHPAGTGAALAMARALADAGAAPADVGFVNLHGTGTPLNDASEWQGIEQVFGERARHLPLTATKASVGHLLGSSGALEAVATVLCLEAGAVHPTPGEPEVDPATPGRLVTGEPLPLRGGRLALSTSFGFGGANSALVLAAEGDAGR